MIHHKHSVSLKFFAGDRRCLLRQKCGKESVGQVGGQTGGRTLLRVRLWHLFSSWVANDSYSYYVTFVWSCNVAVWDISLYLVECRTCAVIRLVRLTPPRCNPPAYPFTLGRFTNNEALILPPEADQCRSRISPLSASETFTQRRVRRISAGSPHANGSVNAACYFSWALSPSPTVVQKFSV